MTKAVADYGIRIDPRVQDGPLWKLSPRALRLWLYLAMKSQHAPVTRTLKDGHGLLIDKGQWLTSYRELRKHGMGSLTSVTSALSELKAVGAVTVKHIPRSENQNGGVLKNGTGGVLKVRTAEAIVATLVTVMGQSLTAHPVPKIGTKDKYRGNGLPPVSRKEQEESERADAILSAEGR